MLREDFEQLVTEALISVPSYFQEKLENVGIVIDDFPSDYQLRKVGLKPGMTLFGLYEGIPKTKRGVGYMMVLPDKITIFQKPIEYFYTTGETIKAKVRETVLHEIGHHFGLSDQEIVSAQLQVAHS